MFTNAWRTGHKIAWDVPRACHTYLVETVLAPHVGSLIASLLHRQVGFFHSLLTGPCKEATSAALLASREKRSTIGANLALVGEMTGLDPWTAGRTELRAALETAEMSPVPPSGPLEAPGTGETAGSQLPVGRDRSGQITRSHKFNCNQLTCR